MSSLAVRVHSKRLAGDIPRDVDPGLAGAYLTSEGARKTEDAALNRWVSVPSLSAFHERLLLLEVIALNPQLHKNVHVRNRPVRALHQEMARVLWIAGQPGVGIPAKEVREWLNNSSEVLKKRANAGLVA